MLEELEIHDLGPIHRALLTPAGGMTAITGETGAGKSMLLSAIRLISGGPASSGRVSPGASEAWAQGVFAVDDRGGVAQEARDAGAVLEDGELYLSRTVPVSAVPIQRCASGAQCSPARTAIPARAPPARAWNHWRRSW